MQTMADLIRDLSEKDILDELMRASFQLCQS